MEQPKVTVILPTHNRAHLVGEAIQSVVSQTYSNWELIVIDDGSTDKTREAVEAFAQRDRRIRYVFQRNRGVSSVRAKGVELAQGKYVTFLDDDDAFYPEKLEIQVEFLEQHPTVELVYSYVDMVNGEKDFLRTWPTRPAVDFVGLIRECTIQPNSLLVRKECFERLGSFRTDLRSCDDYDMWLRIAKIYPIEFLPAHVGTYRWHDGNLSFNWRRRCQSYVRIFKWWLRQNLMGEERREVTLSALRMTYLHAVDAFEARDYDKAAYYFLMSLKFSPFVGQLVPWSRFSNGLYRLLKPYAAFLYCHVRALMPSHKEGGVSYAKA